MQSRALAWAFLLLPAAWTGCLDSGDQPPAAPPGFAAEGSRLMHFIAIHSLGNENEGLRISIISGQSPPEGTSEWRVNAEVYDAAGTIHHGFFSIAKENWREEANYTLRLPNPTPTPLLLWMGCDYCIASLIVSPGVRAHNVGLDFTEVKYRDVNLEVPAGLPPSPGEAYTAMRTFEMQSIHRLNFTVTTHIGSGNVTVHDSSGRLFAAFNARLTTDAETVYHLNETWPPTGIYTLRLVGPVRANLLVRETVYREDFFRPYNMAVPHGPPVEDLILEGPPSQ